MRNIAEAKVIFDKNYFANLLKEKKKKMYVLAEKCGLERNAISKLKIGRTKDPNFETVYNLSIALNCEMEDLMCEIYD